MRIYLRKKHLFPILVFLICAVLIFVAVSCRPYQKMNPAADVDKGPPVPAPPNVDNSCWMATAANMLACVGYGNGNTVQQRADDIYADMVANYGKTNTGWPEAALEWWLFDSPHNTWTNNPYTVVTPYGNKSMYPWDNPNIPQTIGNELRRCLSVGLWFSWPVAGATVGTGGHATTAWGDNLASGTLPINPTEIRMADSDRDGGGIIQVYTYDAYNNPNPGGPNEGNGCYFDYSNNHPYVRGIVTLSPTDDPSDDKQTQIVVGSYRIHQSNEIEATDLHYRVGTDTIILSYKTEIDWGDELTPTIVESQPQRTELTVDWDLIDNPVPYCEWVTITTEFVLPTRNAIEYEDVHFTYPEPGIIEIIPNLDWAIVTPMIKAAHTIEDVTGGFVIGSFDIVNPEVEYNNGIIAEYRFIHQYYYNQDPELHYFTLSGQDNFNITNVRFGHTYGIPTVEELWKFDDWMTEIDKIPLEEKKYEFTIDWEGQLPYPKGMDIREVIDYIQQEETSRTITWWLILVIIVAIGLIIWGVVWRRRRRRAAQEG